ncbi:MAG: cupin [Thermomicrobiales bacterium]|nr:MAG: cupin [Thermomicrobiales bacterium]
MEHGSTPKETGSRTCAVIRADATYEGKQGFSYVHGISAEQVGSTGICMHLLTIPPGGRAKAHLHENHETAIYVLSGHARMRYGEELEHELACGPGDMIYIPAGMPHLPYNASQSEPCTAVLARTDPNEQESVVLRPDLDDCVPG